MNIENLLDFGIEEGLLQKFKQEGIKKLYPIQAEAINKGLFKMENLVLACPTASGKTFIATLAIINILKKKQGKVIYLVPLIALANEKYSYYKNLFGEEFKTAVSVGDLDSTSPWLASYNLVISTTEKLDSLLRHGVGWLRDVDLIIVDEVHLINDESRGPTLEVLLCRLRQLNRNAQLLALSATISNACELASWLNAGLVESDFRPVKLYEGVYSHSHINFLEKIGYKLTDEQPEIAITKNTLLLKKQALFFVATRRSAESLAERVSSIVDVSSDRKKDLDGLAKESLSALEVPTHQCKKLASCLKRGIAFHHAGLVSKQKRLIEDNFRGGLIKVIVATPTLAMGVNLPAFRVVIRDAKRYYPGQGSVYIPILEYKQFVGRAGRPQYDEFGESILVSKSEEDAEELVEHYIKGKPENIESKLAQESALRMHTLALIAGSITRTEESLLEFFHQTFFGFQYQDINLIAAKIGKILENLGQWGFLEAEDSSFKATRLGKRIAELYIDPLTAYNFITALEKAQASDLEDFGILQLISHADEMRPLLSVKSKDFIRIEDTIAQREYLFLEEIPARWDSEYDSFLESVKMALCFEIWIEEETEEFLLDEFKITPGELHAKLEIADWLMYCLEEIIAILKYEEVIPILRKLRIRLSYGIKEELLDLVRLKGIGRMRSRKLFKARIRSRMDLRNAPLERLEVILGSHLANSLKEQLQAGGDKADKILYRRR